MRPLSPEQVTDVAEVFRLLGEPNRLRIVLACLETACTVGEIVEALKLSQSLTSHHLRLLRTARILRAVRHGPTSPTRSTTITCATCCATWSPT